GLGFLQKPDDLLFRKALLHVRLLLRKRTLLDSGWPCLQGAGHLRLCLDNDQIQQELSSLGVQHAVDSELTNWIVSRPDMEIAWTPSQARWDVLAERLDWVN
ncbi:hypothetical protein QZM01_25665, partial [Burkholderia multivorans]|nr:hypothetical protein [Burkholderia multivorans]